MPRSNAANCSPLDPAEPLLRNPITGIVCCARAESGQAAAEQRDERAPVMIELHAIPHEERGRTAGYRIGGDQSAGSLPSPDDKCQLKAGWLPSRTQVAAARISKQYARG